MNNSKKEIIFTQKDADIYLKKIDDALKWIKTKAINIAGITKIKKGLERYKNNFLNFENFNNKSLKGMIGNIETYILKVDTIKKTPNVRHVEKIFEYSDDYEDIYSSVIHIVGANCLVKVICEKNVRLDNHIMSMTNYMEYGKRHQINWQNPAIVYRFCYGIDDEMAEELKDFGIHIWSDDNFDWTLLNPKKLDIGIIDKNIVMTCCSEFTNSNEKIKIGLEGEYWERLVKYIEKNLPKTMKQKNMLEDKLKTMKKIYMTQKMYNSMEQIMDDVAGDNEKKRYAEFMKKFNVEIIDFNLSDEQTFEETSDLSSEYTNMLECAKKNKLYIFSASKSVFKSLKKKGFRVNSFLCPLVILSGM